MAKPTITDKRWSIDLKKRIQEAHYADPEVYNKRYGFNPKSGREIFVIDTPPPYPSGTWHIGAVAQYSMIDVIARSQRLLGKEVYFPWGVDRNGINIEFTVEKNTEKMKTYDRAEFLRLCQRNHQTYHQPCVKRLHALDFHVIFNAEYLTDAPDYRAVTQAIFVDLFKRGEIVEDLRPNIYDLWRGRPLPMLKWSVCSGKHLVDVKWVTENGDELIISTTRPELICACGVVVVHPDDERYAHLVGQRATLPVPVEGRSQAVEIQTHPQSNRIRFRDSDGLFVR